MTANKGDTRGWKSFQYVEYPRRRYRAAIVGLGPLAEHLVKDMVFNNLNPTEPELSQLYLVSRKLSKAERLHRSLRLNRGSTDSSGLESRLPPIQSFRLEDLPSLSNQIDVMVITASATQQYQNWCKPFEVGPDRDVMTVINSSMLASLASNYIPSDFAGNIVVLTNNVDITPMIIAQHSGVDPRRIVGVTEGDSERLQMFIEQKERAKIQDQKDKFPEIAITGHHMLFSHIEPWPFLDDLLIHRKPSTEYVGREEEFGRLTKEHAIDQLILATYTTSETAGATYRTIRALVNEESTHGTALLRLQNGRAMFVSMPIDARNWHWRPREHGKGLWIYERLDALGEKHKRARETGMQNLIKASEVLLGGTEDLRQFVASAIRRSDKNSVISVESLEKEVSLIINNHVEVVGDAPILRSATIQYPLEDPPLGVQPNPLSIKLDERHGLSALRNLRFEGHVLTQVATESEWEKAYSLVSLNTGEVVQSFKLPMVLDSAVIDDVFVAVSRYTRRHQLRHSLHAVNTVGLSDRVELHDYQIPGFKQVGKVLWVPQVKDRKDESFVPRIVRYSVDTGHGVLSLRDLQDDFRFEDHDSERLKLISNATSFLCGNAFVYMGVPGGVLIYDSSGRFIRKLDHQGTDTQRLSGFGNRLFAVDNESLDVCVWRASDILPSVRKETSNGQYAINDSGVLLTMTKTEAVTMTYEDGSSEELGLGVQPLTQSTMSSQKGGVLFVSSPDELILRPYEPDAHTTKVTVPNLRNKSIRGVV